MALTLRDERPSASQLKLREIALDNSYPAGGYAHGFQVCLPLGGSTAGFLIVSDPVNRNLRVFRSGTAVSTAFQEVPAATDLSAVSFLALVGCP